MNRLRKEVSWLPPWLPEEADIFGYPDSLIRARTAKAYDFVLNQLDVRNKRCLDIGSGYGHGVLRCTLIFPL